LVSQRLSQGRIVPRIPSNERLQGQTGLAKTIGHRFDVLALDIRPQTTDLGFGMLIGSLPLKDFDKGRHKGVQTWEHLLENFRGHLTFSKQLAFANGVPRVHG
jgi:hypothetical protein